MPRNTRQRDAIRRVFADSGRPLSPDEALEMARKMVPGLGIATVYRNVKRLSETGWLTPVDLPGTGVRYELAEQPHHHHFVCRSCDQAFDVDACPPAVEELAPGGFEVESHEVILYGRCPACAEPSAP